MAIIIKKKLFAQEKVMELLCEGNLREEETQEMVKTAMLCAQEFDLEFIALNFAALQFINSIGLTQMLSLKRQLDQKGVQLFLVSLSPYMNRIFQETQLCQIFPSKNDIETLIKEEIHEKRK